MYEAKPQCVPQNQGQGPQLPGGRLQGLSGWSAPRHGRTARAAYPWQGPGLGDRVLHHQHLQHFLYALPADGSVLVPPPPVEGTARGIP